MWHRCPSAHQKARKPCADLGGQLVCGHPPVTPVRGHSKACRGGGMQNDVFQGRGGGVSSREEGGVLPGERGESVSVLYSQHPALRSSTHPAGTACIAAAPPPAPHPGPPSAQGSGGSQGRALDPEHPARRRGWGGVEGSSLQGSRQGSALRSGGLGLKVQGTRQGAGSSGFRVQGSGFRARA